MTPFYRFQNTVDLREVVPPLALEWEVISDDLWLRPFQSDVQIAWCYFSYGSLSDKLLNPTPKNMAAKKIRNALVTKRFWRFWPLASLHCELFLQRSYGLIRLPDKPLLARFDFPGMCRNGNDVLFAEPAYIEKLVGELEGQKDFQETLDWLQGYKDAWSSLYFERGDRAQLETLLKALWALFCPPDFRRQTWEYSSYLSFDETVRWYWPHTAFSPYKEIQDATERLIDLLHEAIVVKESKQLYNSTIDGNYNAFPHVRVTVPSMHERMEAMIVWREFLSSRISLNEINSLLPFSPDSLGYGGGHLKWV